MNLFGYHLTATFNLLMLGKSKVNFDFAIAYSQFWLQPLRASTFGSVLTFPFLFISAFSVARSERLIQRQRSLHWHSASFASSAWGLFESGYEFFLHADYAESAEFLFHFVFNAGAGGSQNFVTTRVRRGRRGGGMIVSRFNPALRSFPPCCSA